MIARHSHAPAASPDRSGPGRLSQTHWIIIAMVLGVAVGCLFPDSREGVFHASDLEVLSSIFLRMIKSLVAPLIFATLVVGIAGYSEDMKGIGRLALRSLFYFEVVTTLALVIGLTVATLVQPGRGVALAAATTDAAVSVTPVPTTVAGILEHIVPQSFIDAAARNDPLQIVFFTILFAVALSQVQGAVKWVMLTICESLTEIMFKLVEIIMKFAPLGIGGAIAATVGRSGIGALTKLGALVLTLYGSLIVFVLLVLLPVAVAFRVPLRRFWGAVKQPWTIAFTTASSEAALPVALRNMEQLGVPRHIVSFVLPTGYAFNMDGTALYLSLAAMFVAQAAGVDLSLRQQIVMMLTLMLTSKGVAAVPRASLVILSGTLVQFGLPLTGIAVILGVDALLDMARTSLNLLGNCLATVIMARWEGSFALTPELAPAHHSGAGKSSLAHRSLEGATT